MDLENSTKVRVSQSSKNINMSCHNGPLLTRENQTLSPIFDRLRGRPEVNILWVKEQIYGTPCIPETCPETRTMSEVFGVRDTQELEEREIRERPERREK